MQGQTIHSIENLIERSIPGSRILVLFSGGLDGAYILHRLGQLRGVEVIALTVELGGVDSCETAKQNAEKLKTKSLVIDGQKIFAQEFVLPALQAQSCYLNAHPISASLSRPLLAKLAFDVAREKECNVIVHTATPSQNSMRRFNGALEGLGFRGTYGSPYELSILSREEKQKALGELGMMFFKKRNYSGDSNLWCNEFESGRLEDPEKIEIDNDLYQWSREVESQSPQGVDISFENGAPCALNGESMTFETLVKKLNAVVGSYGLGRYVGLEEIDTGAKVLEVREMPAAFVLMDALRRLESAALDDESIRKKMVLEQVWTREASEGRWFFPLREACQEFIKSITSKVAGTVSYQLSSRELRLTSIKARRPLYVRDRTQYEADLINKKLGYNPKVVKLKRAA